MALTARQQRFVAEYLIDLNATQAAIRAGYSAKTASSQGERLLRNVEVRAAVDAALKARAERVEVKQDDVLRALAEIAMADIGEAFDSNGNLKPLKDMPASVRRAIASVETETNHNDEDNVTVSKVKFWDKPKALELIGRHLKMFTDKVEHDVTDSFAALLVEAQKRERGPT